MSGQQDLFQAPPWAGPDAPTLSRRLGELLDKIADPGLCRGCGTPIFWVVHKKTQKRVPYTIEGLNHFVDCPERDQFRKGRR